MFPSQDRGEVKKALWSPNEFPTTMCVVGWCGIKLALKSQNPQTVFGSLINPEQFFVKKIGHRMYKVLRNCA